MTVRLEAIANIHVRLEASKMIQRVDKELRDFAADVVSVATKYPPQRNTHYRRTGRLGRGWMIIVRDIDSIDVVNRVPYASIVMGPTDEERGQAEAFAERGWRSISDIADEQLKKHKDLMRKAIGPV